MLITNFSILIYLVLLCTAQRLTYNELIPSRISARLSRMTSAVSETVNTSPNPTGIRRQQTYPLTLPFPCKNMTAPGIGRSMIRPTSVHKLRPGDIDVIGAMGDSLVAGNGALEEYAMGTLIEYRGVSWAAGGEATWRSYLTLPNILKEFNPALKGYSVGKGEFLAPNSHMNVAFPVSADYEAYKQAQFLVKKMKRDSSIDFKNDWKLVTMFFGANDLCSGQCYDKDGTTPLQHSKKLQKAIDYLQDNLPRTIVNLVPVLDVSVSVRVKRSFMCHMLHRFFCACFHQRGNVNEMDEITQLVRDYQGAEQILINSGKYNKKEDFTVVIQPFIKLFNAPLDKKRQFEEVIDISYVTYDCFHFSQKGHALAANLLWNNMMQPVGAKSESSMDYIMQEFLCPTLEHPYIYTANNSYSFNFANKL
ncbi:phospholipase B1, membrane-associated-like [Daktulosphaira vitifoliae]|uniref:phospholipase B1, membrane-associated-like n=1 Tax=Daktulosphaira vitifoliae TaxID=58002 RepID=UPI0021AA514D|nr:phospholipase B1, membrane-associated-like [Daktulosphaira vitifoliae]XP_050525609.1 phospholipase B1, membrane-associated-like [Daktulosphaira vitifoliae]